MDKKTALIISVVTIFVFALILSSFLMTQEDTPVVEKPVTVVGDLVETAESTSVTQEEATTEATVTTVDVFATESTTETLTTEATTTVEAYTSYDSDSKIDLLGAKDKGSCRSLTGNVHVVLFLINDPIDFNQEENSMSELKRNFSLIEEAAADHGKNLKLTLSEVRVDTYLSYNSYKGDSKSYAEAIVQKAGYLNLSDFDRQTKVYFSSDYVVPVFCTGGIGRAFANSARNLSSNEYIVLMSSLHPIPHEIMHLFGAQDFYSPVRLQNEAAKAFGKSIMLNSEDIAIDDFTAYLIGWESELSETAQGFYQNVYDITKEEAERENGLSLGDGKGIIVNSYGIYKGDYVGGSPHGYGKLIFNDGRIYEGYWYNGNFNGEGTYTYEDGSVYHGQWEKGERNGNGKHTYSDGSYYEGEWKKSKFNGIGTFVYGNGSVYEGDWVDGKQDGKGTLTFSDGSTYNGMWSAGERCGEGTLTYTNGNSYTGNWLHGKFNGYGTFLWANGDKFEGEWIDGNRTGYGKYTWANGKIKEGQWKNNKYVEQ